MKRLAIVTSLLFLGLLLFLPAVNVSALSSSPPQVRIGSYSFDNPSNPHTLKFDGNAIGGSKQILCSIEQDTQQTLEYAVISASYSIAGTSLSGNVALRMDFRGQDGECVAVGDGGAKPYVYSFDPPTTVNISSLSAGTYTLKVTVVGERGYSSSGYSYASDEVSFTVNRPAPPPQTCTLSVKSNLSTSWTLSGPATYSGSGTAANYTNAPTGSYTISASDLQGYNKSISPSETQTCSAGGTTTFSITYTPTGDSQTHSACVNNSCQVVTGSGSNECSTNSDCSGGTPPGHFTLNSPACSGGANPQVSLSWSQSSGAKTYDVWRCRWSSCDGLAVIASNLTTTSYADTNVQSNIDYYYTITAKNDYGTTDSDTQSVNTAPNNCTSQPPNPNPPSVSISCSPSTILYGNSGIVSWSSQNVTACTVSPGGWNGTSGSQSTGAITQNTTYTATCTVGGSGGQKVCELENSKGVRGSSNCTVPRNATSSLSSASQCASWCGTNNAGACEWDKNNKICYWYTGDNSCYLIDAGGWMADAQCAVRQGGSQNTVSQSCTFSIAQSHNICTQDGACVQISGAGPNECSDPGTPDSLNCPQPPPSCSAFNADPEKFPYPPAKSVTLSWTCTKAHNGCSISPGSLIKGGGQNLPQSGSVQTLPLTQTTDFVLRCQGRGGTSPDYHLPLGTLRVYQFVGGRLKEVSPLGR